MDPSGCPPGRKRGKGGRLVPREGRVCRPRRRRSLPSTLLFPGLPVVLVVVVLGLCHGRAATATRAAAVTVTTATTATSPWAYPDLDSDLDSGAYSSASGFASGFASSTGPPPAPPPNCTASGEQGHADAGDQIHDRLECFLWNLEIPVPDQAFQKDWITVAIHDVVCTNVRVSGLDLERLPPSGPTRARARAHARAPPQTPLRTRHQTDCQTDCRAHSHSQPHSTSQPQPQPHSQPQPTHGPIPPAPAQAARVSFLGASVRGISVTCKGRYRATGGLEGDLRATIREKGPGGRSSPALEAVFALEGRSETFGRRPAPCLPAGFRTDSCRAELECSSVDFSGSASARLVRAFAGPIARFVTGALGERACPLLEASVDPVLVSALRRWDDWVRPYLDDGEYDGGNFGGGFVAAEPRAANASSASHGVADYPVVRGALASANKQLSEHLQTGWIPWTNDRGTEPPSGCADAFRGISGWIGSLLGPRPEFRLPPFFRRVVLPFAGGKAVLNLSEMALEGLDRMDALGILDPSLPQGLAAGDSFTGALLHTRCKTTRGFFVVLPVELEIHLPPPTGPDLPAPPVLLESFVLAVNLTRIETSLASLARVVDWESTSLLSVVVALERYSETGDPSDLACLVGTLDAVKVVARRGDDSNSHSNTNSNTNTNHTEASEPLWWIRSVVLDSVRLSRGPESTPPSHALGAGLDRALNTVLELLVEDYQPLWTQLARGLLRGPAADALNALVRDWIQRHSPGRSAGTEECLPGEHGGGGPVAGTGRWADLTRLEALYGFNRWLERPHTRKFLNGFLSCLAEAAEAGFNGEHGEKAHLQGVARARARSRSAGVAVGFRSGVPRQLANDHAAGGGASEAFVLGFPKLVLKNWDSLFKLQLLKPSAENRLESSLVFGRIPPGETDFSAEPIDGPAEPAPKSLPEATLVFDAYAGDGDNSPLGKLNLTLFGSLETNAEINLDYDLDRLGNLTVSRVLEDIGCSLLPAVQARILPGTTNLGGYLGANLTVALADGRNLSLSTNDYPGFAEIGSETSAWFLEFFRTAANHAIERWIGVSIHECAGGSPVDTGSRDDSGNRKTWWIGLGLVVSVAQLGLLFFVARTQGEDGRSRGVLREADGSHDEAAASHHLPLLSSYQELMTDPIEAKEERNNSIDDFIIRDICEEWNEEEISQGILEDQLVDEARNPEDPKTSIFDSDQIPEAIKSLVPAAIIGTAVLLVSSNASAGASVDLSVRVGLHAMDFSGLFRFGLGSTLSELYFAGVYPLLGLVLGFSGILPYARLFLMLNAWMTPSLDQHRREKNLLTMDSIGRFSLVHTYVLILLLVVFRFHSEFGDGLGVDVHVSMAYGFFSFLVATCLSLILGHATLIFHGKTMRGGNSIGFDCSKRSLVNHAFKLRQADGGSNSKRLSRFAQALLLLAMFSTIAMLSWGFLQHSFTFEIGGMAGIVLGEDMRRTSYSVLSLGFALPSSVENSRSVSIMFLQFAFLLFTVVTPILCLVLLICLMLLPLTLKWQQHFLLATRIARSWSAIEVFLLTMLAVLYQISILTSFIIGNKCDQIDTVAQKLFPDEPNAELVCFTVDALVESNAWYLVVGVLVNFAVVSFGVTFAENAVNERTDDWCVSRNRSHASETTRCNRSFAQTLSVVPLVGTLLFITVPDIAIPLDDEVVPNESRHG